MKTLRKEEGQTLVLTALCMMVLLGFLALAIDVGLLFRARRNLQIVADAAATAAALDYAYNDSVSTAIAAGQSAANKNYLQDGVEGATVAVNCPPVYGPNIDPSGSCNGFFEARVTSPKSGPFMGSIGFGSMTVGARAVAASVAGEGCIYLMNESGTDFLVQGNASLTGPGGAQTCAIYSNSPDEKSVVVKCGGGGSNYINAAYIGTVGGLSGSGGHNTQPTPVTPGVSPQNIPDRLNYDVPAPPDPASCPPATGPQVNVSGTKYNTLVGPITPGSTPVCFSGNVMLQGTADNPLLLNPGMYIFTGNVAIGNNVDGNSISLDIYNGSLSVTSTTNVTLSAPTSGDYYGALILAPWTNTSNFNIQWGSADGKFDGIIFAPGASVTLQDQGGSAIVAGLVVGDLILNGDLTITNYAANHPASPLSTVVLVE